MRILLVCCLAGCVTIGSVTSPILRAEQKPDPAKVAPPSNEEQVKAEKSIRTIFKSDFSKAKSLTDKSELAQKLLQTAVEEKDDRVSRFVLFRLAMDLAGQAGSQKTAYEAIDEMAAHYDVEPLGLKKDVLLAMAKTQSVATPARELMLLILKAVEQAIAAEEFESAISFSNLADSTARLTKDGQLMARANASANRVREVLKDADAAKSAQAVLAMKPDDPAANLAVGKYVCLVKNDWSKGLPMLAKGNDARLKSLAQQDLANPTAAADQMKLADVWWDAAAGESVAWKASLQKRAYDWYKKALPMLTGLNKAKAEKRMAELMPDEDAPPRPATVASSAGNKNPAGGKTETPPAKKGPAVERKTDSSPTGKGAIVIQPPNQQCMTLAFSPDSKRLVTGGSRFTDDSAMRVWNAATGREILAIKTNNDFIQSVAFSPDGKWIVAGTLEGMVRLYDATTGKEIEKMALQCDRWVHAVSFTPDGKRIVTGGGGANTTAGDLRMWDANTGQMLMTNTGHQRGVYCLAVSPDSTRFVTGGWDKVVKVWNVASGQTARTLTGHTLTITGVDFRPDGKRFLSCSLDQTIKIWDTETGQELLSIGPTGCCQHAVFSPNGKRIVSSGGRVPELKVWDAETGTELATLKGHTDFIYFLAISPDGKRAATTAGDRTVRIWDLDKGE